MESFSWTCPYCTQNATITDSNSSSNIHRFDGGSKAGSLSIYTFVTVCPNKNCEEYEVEARLYKNKNINGCWETVGDSLFTWKLKPTSSAKPFPSYIPKTILKDYEEACLIKDLSPQASATLSRRCLQGIIRNYWKISNARLIDEINELKDKIDPITWDTIDSVCSTGNIGAHMGKNINLIIEVAPHEVNLLIGLIEILLEDWYISRHEREQHLKNIVKAAAIKKEDKKEKKT